MPVKVHFYKGKSKWISCHVPPMQNNICICLIHLLKKSHIKIDPPTNFHLLYTYHNRQLIIPS